MLGILFVRKERAAVNSISEKLFISAFCNRQLDITDTVFRFLKNFSIEEYL